MESNDDNERLREEEAGARESRRRACEFFYPSREKEETE